MTIKELLKVMKLNKTDVIKVINETDGEEYFINKSSNNFPVSKVNYKVLSIKFYSIVRKSEELDHLVLRISIGE